ncbi:MULTISPECIES: class I SAM-dependent methyltransferase [Brevibacillus]|jgi:Methylase involved in ubiquinone/menaquinone biosynthesis|uniref:class I SAM-dependent methyltransferase n=1 Tax=Brevibacillus TaxID=55080 RepID=UPI00156BC744|nr:MULTISPECIES: class I SAM-dependent methyltransferase [Brevibacillus]MBU8713677.1 methyltransferase domain-containing protein [Brevibacillus parabrevis]MED2256173.1 class I SAM-dependent methyltransferase [Brevibacillus parabrevis]UED68667.1 class I SAM-dependent methyltransferase [Brevibacillus sp. HD3.3A]WDV94956.1 class I SAM-dependent methyltransferase [Brevibacillus parabrevis]
MSWDPVWEEVFRQQAWGKYPGEDLIRFIARNFYNAESRQDVKILEVGCGPGANLWYMAKEGFTIYGVDGSETAIKQAKLRLDSECPGWTGELIVGDISNLPFPDETFDAVIDSEALSCNLFDNSALIYTEMARVTKQNGKFFSRTFAKGSWGDETGEKVGYNTFLVSEGPLLGKGYARFTHYDDIQKLIQHFTLLEIQLLSREYLKENKKVKEWVIVGEK